jgi:hypothetical protein
LGTKHTHPDREREGEREEERRGEERDERGFTGYWGHDWSNSVCPPDILLAYSPSYSISIFGL